MKHAIMIMAHKNFEFLHHLIEYFTRDCYVFVHIDKKSSITHEQEACLRAMPQVNGVYRKYSVHWGGFSILKCELFLLKQAIHSSDADYFHLISGQDYPIVPTEETERRLEENRGMNYLNTVRPGEERYSFYRKLCEVAYPQWINQENIPVKIFKRLYKTVTGGETHTFGIFIRKKPFDFEFIFGSQWWTLTREAAFAILQFSDDHPEVLKYCEKMIIPDESFFQTVFMQGAYSGKLRDGLTYAPMERSSRHADTLREPDYEAIRKAGEKYCFARKFDSGSRALIRRIEKERGR